MRSPKSLNHRFISYQFIIPSTAVRAKCPLWIIQYQPKSREKPWRTGRLYYLLTSLYRHPSFVSLSQAFLVIKNSFGGRYWNRISWAIKPWRLSKTLAYLTHHLPKLCPPGFQLFTSRGSSTNASPDVPQSRARWGPTSGEYRNRTCWVISSYGLANRSSTILVTRHVL